MHIIAKWLSVDLWIHIKKKQKPLMFFQDIKQNLSSSSNYFQVRVIFPPKRQNADRRVPLYREEYSKQMLLLLTQIKLNLTERLWWLAFKLATTPNKEDEGVGLRTYFAHSRGYDDLYDTIRLVAALLVPVKSCTKEHACPRAIPSRRNRTHGNAINYCETRLPSKYPCRRNGILLIWTKDKRG